MAREAGDLASDLNRVLADATFVSLALLDSPMHMAWLRQIGARLETYLHYSVGLVYSRFLLLAPKPGAIQIGFVGLGRALDAPASHPRPPRRHAFTRPEWFRRTFDGRIGRLIA